jgi:hypothetical protein
VLDQPTRPSSSDPLRPLIIITTNEERELPPAFVRRCIVLNLAPDKDYVEWLVDRGRAHFLAAPDPKQRKPWLSQAILESAALQLQADRKSAVDSGLQPPGPAEYLDLLYALNRLAPGQPHQQRDWLLKLSAYAFVKHAAGADTVEALRQSRKPLAVPEASIDKINGKASAVKKGAAAPTKKSFKRA